MDLLEKRQMLAVTPASDFTYTTANDQVAITAYVGSASAVEIPATINSLPVTSIGNRAFFNRTSLTSVAIPSSVTSIDVGAFAQCFSLTSVTIPTGVAGIGNNAFFYCTSLTSVTIPSTVTSIGDQAFYGCSSLASVSIAPGVTSIGSDSFSYCDSLVNLFLPSTVQHLGEYAVDGLSLQGIYFYGNAPQVDPSASFEWDGVTTYYLPEASGWTGQYNGATTAVFPSSMAPTAVAGIRGNGQVQLSWTAPVSTGGLPVTDYTIQYSSNSGSSWQTFTDAVSSATTATVTGLNNGIGYLFRVASVNDVGTGLYSANSSAVTPATTPGLPTAVAGIRSNGQVQLSWTAPLSDGGIPVKDYTVQYSVDGSSWQTFSRVASTAPSVTVTGLRNGTGYLFRVASVNDVGTGSFTATSSSITPNFVPLPPTNIVATRGRGVVTVSWTTPVSTVGVRITDYRVQQSTNGGLSWVTVRDGVSTSTRTVVSGLVMGRDYIFRVSSVGRFGAGDSSSPSRVVVPATVPSVPVGLLATAGIGQVALSWRAPTSSGGSPISQYIVQYSPSAGRWITSTTVGSNTTTATVSGLLANRSYSFRVLAVNDMGNSPASRVVVARTLRPAVVRA
jgi:hypothetical protein